MFLRFKLRQGCRLLLSVTLLFSGALLSSCAPALTAKAPSVSTIVSDDLDAESLRAAIGQSLAYLRKLAPNRIVGEEPRRLTAAEIENSITAFERILGSWSCAACLAQELDARFELIPSSADGEFIDVLFTGYYQPVIAGSLTPSDEYRYPIYGKPADLTATAPVKNGESDAARLQQDPLTPYYSRQQIDEGDALKGRGLEIAWVKDPVDLFFLHIQGSGIISLPDGGRLSVGYAGQNGRPYRSIGRLLIDNGKIAKEEMSMQRIRRYLADHPQEQNEIFAYNESYVFFRVLGVLNDGPLGNLEVPLTAERSIATDSRLFPKGALALIQTSIPIVGAAGELAGWRPVTRLVLNQDTGGAIRGLQRADIYFGTGDQAGALAGYMNRPGRLYFLLLKQEPEKNRERDLR
jgi:membrane-bound lytic murein transglycosylase A